MAGKNKSSNVIFEERISIVTDMILSGLKRRDIIQNISTNEQLKWNVTPRQIDNYISVADSIITESIKEDRNSLIAKSFSKYQFIYKKLINVKDYKGAISAIEKCDNLMGLNAPTKISQTDKDGNVPQLINLSLLPIALIKQLLNDQPLISTEK
jgi:hypothetical protein